MTPEPTTCIHCGRTIVNRGGAWIDPEATGDDSLWAEVCDAHYTFIADHEPPDVFTDLETSHRARIQSGF